MSFNRLAGTARPLLYGWFKMVSALAIVLASGSLSALAGSHQDMVIATHGVVPVCNDGSIVNLAAYTWKTSTEKTLTGISISTKGTTELSDITEIGVAHVRKKGNREFAIAPKIESSFKLVGRLDFKKGEHKIELGVRVRKNASLLHRVGVQISALHFEDGSTLDVPPQVNTQPQRLAYPIHRQNEFDCHTFRIPAISKANNGDLLAVYDMRYNSRRDLQEDIDIGLSRSSDGGQTWSEPTPIMDMGEYGGKPQRENGCSDPGILVDANTGEIFVTAVWTFGKPNTHQWSGKGSEPGFEIGTTAQFMVVRSTDNGRSWSKPENWTKKLKKKEWWLFAPAPGNGITLKDGTLVIPTQGRDKQGHPFSNLTYSKDHGKTWTVSNPARADTTECAVAELSDGTLMLNMRDNRNRKLKGSNNGRAVSTTNDLGKTWSLHKSDHSLLPEPTCMASLIAVQNESSRFLFFSNPRNKSQRAGMTVQMSSDDGTTWPEHRHVLLDSRGGAYSSLVMIDEETIGILYESSVADMIFQKIPLSDFAK